MTPAIAAAWSFAEAMLFFVVVDLWVSLIALERGLRAGLLAAGAATAGALAGGALMYRWGVADAAGVRDVLDAIPAISRDMIATASETGMIRGAFTGIPFKVFAAEAGAAGESLTRFLALAAATRFFRFALVAIAAAASGAVLQRSFSRDALLRVLGGLWIAFYAAFLTLMPW